MNASLPSRILCCALTAPFLGSGVSSAQEPVFVRGDSNQDGRVTLADASRFFAWRFLGAPAPGCLDAVDADDTGAIDTAGIADVVFLMDWLVRSTGAPRALPAPFPEPGPDPSPDGLPCADPTVTEPGPSDPRFGMAWDVPPALERGAREVELFLLATTAGAIESFSIAYRIDRSVFTDIEVDLSDTVFPEALRRAYETSPAFRHTVGPSADPDFLLVLAGAVLVSSSGGGYEVLDFPATRGPIRDAPLLRLTARVREDAPLGTHAILLPAPRADLFPAGDIIHGIQNEFGIPGPIPSQSNLASVQADTTTVIIDGEEFLRGNANGDVLVDISDAVSTLSFLFSGGPAPGCEDAADANDDGNLDISDASFTLNYLFLGSIQPPAPGPKECGYDETGDELVPCFDGCP